MNGLTWGWIKVWYHDREKNEVSILNTPENFASIKTFRELILGPTDNIVCDTEQC